MEVGGGGHRTESVFNLFLELMLFFFPGGRKATS